MSSGDYHTEPQANSVVTTIEASIPTVDVNMTVEEEKLFNCHLHFTEQPKDVDKSSQIVPCDTQSVTCTQELIPVTSLIDSVCTMQADVGTVESEAKADVNYFNYMPKDMDTIEDNSLHKEPTDDSSKLLQNNTFNGTDIEGDYFDRDCDSQNPEDIKFKCEICSKAYTTQKGLKKHHLSHEKQHKCDICSKTFFKLEELEKHKSFHTPKPHACDLCNASYSKLQSLARHLKSHNEKVNDSLNPDEKKEETDLKKSCKNEDDTEDENDKGNELDGFENAPEIFKCDECGQYCSTLKNLKRHALIHGEKKYSCTVCKKWFFRPDTLKKHAERHGHGLLDNLSEENSFYNDSDDDGFLSTTKTIKTDNDITKKEESEEEGNGEYKCQNCDKIMATKKGLRRHVAMHKPKPEPAVCEICKKVCASQARLTLHQKTHNKPKEKVPREYLCHICSKVYPSNSSLTYHMRTHTGVKPHVCKTCNSGFTTTTSLANHIRIHTGDKPFVCHVCSAAFAVSSAFRRHLTRHTGEANYLCKTCGKAFKRLSTLKEHTYTHSGEKPYVCKTCGAAYSHSGSLFAHQKRCRAQYTEMVVEDHHHAVAHHIHVNNVQSAVRSLAVIGQMF